MVANITPECEPGTYGHYCRSTCGNCSDARPICNTVTGKCNAGCKSGLQPPYCKIPCSFNRWGKDCAKKCSCKKPPTHCGCDPVSGACSPCEANGKPAVVYRQDNKQQCINQYALDPSIKEYKPPSATDMPYTPILIGAALLALFILTNYVWWYFVVRKPMPEEEPVEIFREKKRTGLMSNKMRLLTEKAKTDLDSLWEAGWEETQMNRLDSGSS
ncbi:platelet endothelial aggregation receptor 1-like [Physella acuta]|uniref:platelet endothelial aggregation receptor 1-like n=1 Tax=Physella acuta TaxID=109671 RepID=UPI0027DB5D4B|nr:platelet endothelial aggregation receptor 1-like [Physella acuta]